MKQFLKFTLATFVGLILTGLFFVLLLVIVVSALSSGEKDYALQEKSVLKLDLNGEIVEQGQDIPFNFEDLGLPYMGKLNKQGLDDVLAAIKKASNLPEIKGIYLHAGTMNAGFATAEAIRNALLDFKKTGKYIVAYGDVYDQREYYICSVADNVFLNPSGMVNWCGLAATPVFYAKTLEKLGVEIQVFKVGTFKSAVEPYIKTKMSPESRQQTSEYISDIWNHVLQSVAASRSLTTDELDRLASENQLMKSADQLVASKLVDSLVYINGVRDYMAKKNGVSKRKDLSVVTVKQLLTVPNKGATYKKNKVAVLYAEGEIVDEGTEGITTSSMLEEIENLSDNENIKAVVVRVNSPGGSAFASEQIWQALTELKKKKPVVVSMGNYAASGGYYIACNATKIVASPNTLTGSIGIFAIFPNVQPLTNKLGLSFDVVKTNELSDFGDITRPMTSLEKQKIQRYIDNGYELFVKRCAEGRHMKVEAIKQVAEGRVWTGAKAVKLGLVDELGGLDHAIKLAAKLGKVTDYDLSYYPVKKDFMTVLMEEFAQQSALKLAFSFLGEEYAPFLKLHTSGIQTGILAKMNDIEIR